MKTCTDCRFYEPADRRCRFLPPSFFFNGQYVHPRVASSDWCGQFHPKKSEYPQQQPQQPSALP